MDQNITTYIPEKAHGKILELLNDKDLQVIVKRARKHAMVITANLKMGGIK